MILWSSSRCHCPSFPSLLQVNGVVGVKVICLILLLLDGLSRPGSYAESSSHHLNPHTVSTKYGLIRGIKLQFSSASTRHLEPVSGYLGIPYASPPINAYRFMPPVAPLPWSPGTRNAVSFSPSCPQRFPDVSNRTKALETMTLQRLSFLLKLIPHLENQNEDCLYLNLYVPTTPPGDEVRGGKYAIVFVIHGESWEWGGGSEFDGAPLASLGNHIVVTFNYRLGILGFLKTSNQQSNFGLLDVIAALHWVRENGDAFGGDRNRITLLGYRTGAVIANLLLVAQIAKDLFERAILISGSVLSPWALQKRPEETALQVSQYLSCKGRLPLSHPESDLAPCLRGKHLSDLLNFSPSSPRFLSPFAPYIDNVLLRPPKGVMEGGAEREQFGRAGLLLIFTTSEGVQELSEGELRHGFEWEHRDRVLRTLVRNVFNYHQQEIFSIVRNEYTDWERPILHPIPLRDATVEALSDCLVIAPSIQLALMHSRLKSSATYLMHFAHVTRDPEFTSYERLGSVEGDVVPYVMGLPVTSNVPALGGQPLISPWSSLSNFTKQDAAVSDILLHYLSNFVRTGNPNGNDGGTTGSGEPEWNDHLGGNGVRERPRFRALNWDPFDQVTQLYMNLGVKPRLKSHYRGHKLALWLNLIPQIHLPGGSDVTPAHHVFQDNSASLYIGPVRQMYPVSFGDQIPGFGGPYKQPVNPTSSTVGGLPITTECIESTVPHFSPGSGLTGIDSELEEDVNVKGIGLDSSVSRGLGMRETSLDGDYDYSTALTVTLTVGVCLILLNVAVFSAIMCHRKRGFPRNGGGSGGRNDASTSDSPGSRRGSIGTPLKSPYQDEYGWATGGGEQGSYGACSHLSHPGEAVAMGAVAYGGNGPQLQQHIDYHSQPPICCSSPQVRHPTPSSPLTMLMMAGEAVDAGGHCVQMQHLNHGYNPGDNLLDLPPPPPPGSIRLYMNHGAGDVIQGADPATSTLQRQSAYSNTNSMSHTLLRQSQVQSPSSSGTISVSTTPNAGGNPSPSGGSTTLVGVLKRHNSSATPNSTIKKRVQIQEISV